MIMGIQIAVQSIPNFHIKINEDLNKLCKQVAYEQCSVDISSFSLISPKLEIK